MTSSIDVPKRTQANSLDGPFAQQPLTHDESNSYHITSAFSDAAAHAHALSGWEQSYVQLSAGRFVGTLLEINLDHLKLVRETTNKVIHERGHSQGRHRTICVPVQMNGLAYFNGLPWTINACTSLLGETDFDLITPDSLDLISISADNDRLAYTLTPGSDPTGMAGSAIIRISPRQLPALTIVLNSIFKRIAMQPEILNLAAIRRDIEESVFEVLADALYPPVDTRVPRPIYSVRRRIVQDAIEYVRSDPYGNVSVSDLCRLLHLNRRTLQEYFQDVVKFSPKQYLLAYRLGKVRSLIIDSNGPISIKDAAMRWGFWHLGEFANLYKRLFQELPSCTVGSRQSLCE